MTAKRAAHIANAITRFCIVLQRVFVVADDHRVEKAKSSNHNCRQYCAYKYIYSKIPIAPSNHSCGRSLLLFFHQPERIVVRTYE